MVDVPKSIRILSQKVDYAVELLNAPGASDVQIVTKGVTWSSFKRMWKQQCVRSMDYFASLRQDMRRKNYLASTFQNENPPLVSMQAAW